MPKSESGHTTNTPESFKKMDKNTGDSVPFPHKKMDTLNSGGENTGDQGE